MLIRRLNLIKNLTDLWLAENKVIHFYSFTIGSKRKIPLEVALASQEREIYKVNQAITDLSLKHLFVLWLVL